ncbi:rhodanese-like domain-containing protein [Bacillus thuringiensis]|uniref:Hydroxyacylglutathione hydrolase n=1 Tax=Bacillus thuringiensis Bt18247 TaxID=1423143 RepID=A0A9W3SV96_BACTU|nr:hydroxyacylglutathione hydrolase [Bacillus thuringiensis Bt18247]PGP47630.1 rhodanese-like domain-containing protein [Bacillus thuringiensis]
MMQYITLGNLFEQLDYIPKNCPIVLQCRTGLRSPIAASILQRASIKEVVNLKGGFLVWKEEGRHSRRPSLLCVIPK